MNFNIINNPTDIIIGQKWYGKSINEPKKYLIEVVETNVVDSIVKWKRLDGRDEPGQLDVVGGFLSDFKLTDL